MNKEFVPYEESLALKELGFDSNHYILSIDTPDGRESTKVGQYPILYQQAFRWFREKYNLYQDISTFVWDYDKKQLGFTVRTYLNPLNLDTEKKVHLEVYESYEEAELECLKKLIEIVKNK